jgi:hypothetical protein
MVANCGPRPGANAGGVGRHSPVLVPPVNGGSTEENPSLLRQPTIPSATAWPQAIPSAMPLAVSWALPEMTASDCVRLASRFVFWAG